MSDKGIREMKNRMWRRIILKSIIFAVWTVSMVAVTMRGSLELEGSTYLYMTVGIIAVWITSTVRDVRRLRNRGYLEKAAIAENDERNIQITYRATRLAAVIVACLVPVAICVLAFFDMQDAINALAGMLGVFVLAYLVSWFYIARTC